MLSDDRLNEAIEAAQRWAVFDPDPVTRSAIDRLVVAADSSLVKLFQGRLAFGTAGLRAEVGPGPNRMNALVVRQTTTAVVAHLLAQREAGIGDGRPSVVIGYDARPDSATFAQHAASAAIAGGAQALLADRPLPTPVVAHAVLATRADAAIVITASHNPSGDNGYKLYLGDGRQIVSPVDGEIAARIQRLAESWTSHGVAIDDVHSQRGRLELADGAEWLAGHRRAAIAAVAPWRTSASRRRVAYTPLHGVGGIATVAAFRAAGLADPLIVEEQFEPDGRFPTAPFPNPEEPGTLDLLFELARDEQCDLALAHDPDADRLAVGVPDRNGDWVALSGDELGLLLGDHVLRRLGDRARDTVVARSVVSSRAIDAVAEAAGSTPVVTLTGFKWIARAADDHRGLKLAFGYEEALGYTIGDHVRDKDGITAALAMVALFEDLAQQDQTVWDRLDALGSRFGVYRSAPVTVRHDDAPERVAQAVDALTSDMPDTIAGLAVERVGPIGFGSLPPTSGVQIQLASGSQVIVRPSGTEPKIKAYCEVFEPADEGPHVARAAADLRLGSIVEAVGELLGHESISPGSR